MNVKRFAFAAVALGAITNLHAGPVIVDPPITPDTLVYARAIFLPQDPGYSIAQSFTAEDARIRFGVRLREAEADQHLNAGVELTYRLYAGENAYSVLLATRHATVPEEFTDITDPRLFADVGFVDVDFSQVELTVGQKYTVLITQEPVDHPGAYIWMTDFDAYAGGRPWFPPPSDASYNNSVLENEDMRFRMLPTADSPAEMVAALRQWISGADGIQPQTQKLLVNKLHNVLLKPDHPAYQTVACHQLDSFIKFADQRSDQMDDASAVRLFDEVEALHASIPCP